MQIKPFVAFRRRVVQARRIKLVSPVKEDGISNTSSVLIFLNEQAGRPNEILF